MKSDKDIRTLNPIPQPANVPTLVMQSLARSIISGELAEGDLLPPESEISHQTGAGLSSVREALASLRGMGMISVKHGSGRRVNGLTFAAISDPRISTVALNGQLALDIWEVRRALEVAAIRRAAEVATPEQIASIREAAEAMQQAVASGELGFREDGQIHKAISRATNNPIYAWLQDSIEGLIEGTRKRGLSQPGRQEVSVRDHFELVDAIERHEPEEAAVLMTKHLEAQRGDAMEMLAEERATNTYPPTPQPQHKE